MKAEGMTPEEIEIVDKITSEAADLIASLRSELAVNSKKLTYYKRLAEKADDVINRPFAEDNDEIAKANSKIWEEYQELKNQH